MRVCAFLLILLSASAATASAQSLADVAKQESDRRKTMTGAGKTYSDKDLKPVPPAPVQPDAAATGDKPADASPAADAAAPDKAGADAKTAAPSSKDDKAGVKDEAYWSKRMAALREQLDRDETYLSAIQNRIDSLTTDFVNRDDPAQRGQIAGDRDKALAELERLRKAIEEGRRSISALEEEARREGVPAGWLR